MLPTVTVSSRVHEAERQHTFINLLWRGIWHCVCVVFTPVITPCWCCFHQCSVNSNVKMQLKGKITMDIRTIFSIQTSSLWRISLLRKYHIIQEDLKGFVDLSVLNFSLFTKKYVILGSNKWIKKIWRFISLCGSQRTVEVLCDTVADLN